MSCKPSFFQHKDKLINKQRGQPSRGAALNPQATSPLSLSNGDPPSWEMRLRVETRCTGREDLQRKTREGRAAKDEKKILLKLPGKRVLWCTSEYVGEAQGLQLQANNCISTLQAMNDSRS